jgi:hypothetical protein
VTRVVKLIALLAFAAALLVPTAIAAAASDPTGEQYTRYALIRDDLRACSLDRTWHHLGTTQRKRCVRLRRLYTLWSDPTFSSNSYHVHCNTAKSCPAAPEGEPSPREAIPAGSNIYR